MRLRVLPLLVVLLLASGCLRLRGDLTVDGHGLVSGTMVVAVQAPAGTPVGPVLDQVPEELRGKVATTPYDADGFRGSVLTLRGLTFAEFGRLFQDTADLPVVGSAGLTATLSLTRDGDRVVTSGEFFLPALDGLGSGTGFDARIRITFPGEVLSTNGQRDGRTVTWTLRQSTVEQVRATASLRRSGSASGWRWGGAVVGLLLLAGLGWWWRGRRPAAAVPASGPPVPASGPPAAASGPPPGQAPPDDALWARPGGGGPGLGIPPGERPR